MVGLESNAQQMPRDGFYHGHKDQRAYDDGYAMHEDNPNTDFDIDEEGMPLVVLYVKGTARFDSGTPPPSECSPVFRCPRFGGGGRDLMAPPTVKSAAATKRP